MIKKAYIVEFEKNGVKYGRAFTDLDQMRVHLIHGWDLPYDESRLIQSEQCGVIYDHEGIKITQVGLV